MLASDISSGNLKFTPAANANGAGYATFTFQVQDNGGTANGGVDLDASANTMTVNVTAVNDAPAGTNNTVTTLEDTTLHVHGGRLRLHRSDDSPANAAGGEDHDRCPAPAADAQRRRGHGGAVRLGGRHHWRQLLKFTPAANANGAGYASFTFQVQDDGGTANGGVDLDQSRQHDDRQRHRGQRCAGRHRQHGHHASKTRPTRSRRPTSASPIRRQPGQRACWR